jgi:hypothetical protein
MSHREEKAGSEWQKRAPHLRSASTIKGRPSGSDCDWSLCAKHCATTSLHTARAANACRDAADWTPHPPGACGLCFSSASQRERRRGVALRIKSCTGNGRCTRKKVQIASISKSKEKRKDYSMDGRAKHWQRGAPRGQYHFDTACAMRRTAAPKSLGRSPSCQPGCREK